ncbi:hypothetical protein ACHHYP_15182 [Achlya hypogyna]|uniref:Uncharacterized protein n=1 Tax=Achlya hypogyna TaxID=1202772 RepID=A0A1V9YBF7_ACHHY|nr:hypothetical protein ACHHYP_15182 [Achlya hypogyna]
MNITCIFRDCAAPAVPFTTKCQYHRNRAKCRIATCCNQVYARHLCVSHGGRRRCQFPDCRANARLGNFCTQHGGKKQRCQEPGCTSLAHAKGKCVRHGGRRPCNATGCTTHARKGGYCWRHRDFTASTCDEYTPWGLDQTPTTEIDGLDYAILQTLIWYLSHDPDRYNFWRQLRKGRHTLMDCSGWLRWTISLFHFPHMNQAICCFNGCASPALPDATKCLQHRNRLCCASENCTNQVYARGYCVRHGGKKNCIVDGCESNARAMGLCSRHALYSTKKPCIEDNCTNFAHANQRCVRHGGGRKCKVENCQTLARLAGCCQRHSKMLQLAPKDPELFETLKDLDESILDCVLNSTRPFRGYSIDHSQFCAMETTSMCRFNGCNNEALPGVAKCAFHRHRLPCAVEHCNNIVYARKLCVRHGGRHQCSHSGCDANARAGGLCARHAKVHAKHECSEPSCTNVAHARTKCVRHGGGRRCTEAGCSTLARTGGYCRRHKPLGIEEQLELDAPAALPTSSKCAFHRNRLCCAVDACNNQVYARGLCVRHGGTKPCMMDGCDANARTGGYCSRHSLVNTKKQCIEAGCSNIAHSRKKCVRHGGGRKCKIDGCGTLARIAGYCQRHSKQLLKDAIAPVDADSLQDVDSIYDWLAASTPMNPQLEDLDSLILDFVLKSTSEGLIITDRTPLFSEATNAAFTEIASAVQFPCVVIKCTPEGYAFDMVERSSALSRVANPMRELEVYVPDTRQSERRNNASYLAVPAWLTPTSAVCAMVVVACAASVVVLHLLGSPDSVRDIPRVTYRVQEGQATTIH